MPSDQGRVIEQAKSTFSPLGETFEKQIKRVEEQGKKEIETLKVLKPNIKKLTIIDAIPENTLTEEATPKEIETMVDR